MSQPAGCRRTQAARRARSPSRGARLLAQVRLLHRPQGHRHPVRHHRPPVPPLRLFADDAHALAARLPGRRAAADRQPPRRGAHAGRDDAPRVLQRARGDARHHHGLPRGGPPRRRRIRELRAPAPDWSPGHGVPEAQHGELLVPLPRRRDDAGQLFRPRGSRAVRVDLLRAPRHHRGHGPDVVAHRDDLPDHLVAARSGQLHHDHDPAPRQGAHLHAIPLLRVGPVRHGLPPAPGLPAARGRGGHAADGSCGRHELLPPERPRRQRPGPRRGRRRQPAPLAAPVLVPGAPGSLRPDPSRRWESWPRSSRTTRGSRCGATVRWSTRSSSSASCRSSSGRTTCS